MFIGALAFSTIWLNQSASPQDLQRDRDICAIYALPERPGIDSVGTVENSKRVAEINTDNWRMVVAGAVTGQVSCSYPGTIDELRFSPDGRLAFATGGWRGGPLAGSWGECYYEKIRGTWRTAVCRITALS